VNLPSGIAKLLKMSLQIALLAPLFMVLMAYGVRSETIQGNIDDVARAIQTYFPKLVGKVSTLDGDRLEIEITSGQGLAEGLLLTVFREGAPFRHPVTGVVLGRDEEHLGTLEVLRFDPPRLIARRLAPSPESGPGKRIMVGDLVRLPSTRIPLAIAIRPEGEPFLMNELAAALGDTGRFKVDPLAPGAGVQDAFKRKNRYYLGMETNRKDGRFSMNLQIQNAITGKSLASLAVVIHQSEESDLILEHLQYQLFEQRQKK